MKSETAKQVMVTLIAAFIMIVAAIGVSYAAFSFAYESKNINIIRPGEVYLKLNESNKGISILNASPLSDEEGIKLEGVGYVNSFNIMSSLKKDSNIIYDIVLNTHLENISANMIKVYLVSVDGENAPLESEKAVLGPVYLSELKTSELSNGLSLYSGELVTGDNLVNNYRLKIWIANFEKNGEVIRPDDIDEDAVIEAKLGLYAKAK